MRYAVIQNGIVVNIILADPSFVLPGYTLVQLPDDSLVGIGWLYDGTNFTQPVPPAPAPVTPAPDVNGFSLAVMNQIGIASANALMRQYPLFNAALNAGNFAVASQVLALALSDTTITQDEYNSILAFAAQFNVPLSNPSEAE
jgi:hypothetical protein